MRDAGTPPARSSPPSLHPAPPAGHGTEQKGGSTQGRAAHGLPTGLFTGPEACEHQERKNGTAGSPAAPATPACHLCESLRLESMHTITSKKQTVTLGIPPCVQAAPNAWHRVRGAANGACHAPFDTPFKAPSASHALLQHSSEFAALCLALLECQFLPTEIISLPYTCWTLTRV